MKRETYSMKNSLFLLMIFSSLFAFSQKSVLSSQIEWKDSYRLKWSDFQGKPEMRTSALAATESIITISFKQIDQNISLVEIRSFVEKKGSWVKEKSDKLLKHEQVHADISELFARKIRKAITDNSYRKVEELIETVENEYKKYVKEGGKYQRLYDKETNHSINKEEQKQWESKIEKELQGLSKYSEPMIEIVMK